MPDTNRPVIDFRNFSEEFQERYVFEWRSRVINVLCRPNARQILDAQKAKLIAQGRWPLPGMEVDPNAVDPNETEEAAS